MIIYSRIGRPAEAHGVSSAAEYIARQVHALATFNRMYPARPPVTPTRCDVAPLVGPIVSGGRWVVVCHCHNGPSFDPDWKLALCFECGAAYELAPPDDWQRAEAILMARPSMDQRHWLPGDTVDDLARENVAHGHEVA